jgi:hypothetical protein
MLEDMRKQHPVLRPLGTIGIERGDPSSLRRAVRILETAHQDGPLWFSIFPQGDMHPSWDHGGAFARGIELFARVLAPAVVLPVGIHLEVLADPRPFAFVSIGEPLITDEGSDWAHAVKDAVDAQLLFIRESILEHKERAPERWQS